MSRDVQVRFCVRLRGKFFGPTRLFGSLDGGEAGAVILSLVQTCRGLGINPREYLEDILRRFYSMKVDRIIWMSGSKSKDKYIKLMKDRIDLYERYSEYKFKNENKIEDKEKSIEYFYKQFYKFLKEKWIVKL